MRNSANFIILCVITALSIGSSMASETTMRKSTAEELKSVCDKAGGHFCRMQAVTDVERTVKESPAPIACSPARIARRAVSHRCLGVRAQQAL